MKKLISTLLLFIPSILFAQTYTYTYNFDEPEIISKGNYISIYFDDMLQSGITGEPVLPYFATALLLKPGTEAVSYKIEYFNEKEISLRAQLYPKQAVKPISQAQDNPEFYKNNEIYKSRSVYPAKKEGILTTHFYRGHAIANISFTPVEYIPIENKIKYYSSAKITISYKQTDKASESLKMIKPTDDINKVIDNPENIKEYSRYYTERRDTDYDILVISDQEYEQHFEEINDLYLKYGLLTQFKSTSDIYNTNTGVDNVEKIRNYIIDQYQQHSIEYVVLGGDIDIVPYRGFYCKVISSTNQEDSNIPSDLYFSALDGTWNDNNNDLWGEIGEDDLYPEVSVARMPYSNITEFNAMKNKILKYQAEPVLGELNRPLLAGEELYWNPVSYGSDFLRLLVGLRHDNGYTTEGIPPTDPYDSLYAKDNVWGASDIIQRLNEGPSFVHHSGHSNWNYTMMLYNDDITNQNFSKLDGVQHNYTLVYTHGCICGAFDEDDCIAEHMLKIDNMVVAGCFNSRFGWFNEGQTEGPSAHLHREFVNALYTDKVSELGNTHKISKIKTAPWVNAPGQWEEGALRWCFYDCNALGYSALKIWRDDPYNINVGYKHSVHPNIELYHVAVIDHNHQPLENAQCILFDQNKNIIGKNVTNADGECNISIVGEIPQTGQLELYVSSYNTTSNKYTINIDNSNTSIINFTDNFFTDENENGLAEFDENIEYNVSLKNIGTLPATDILISVTSSNDNLIILQNEFVVSEIQPDDSYVLKIPMKISLTVDDQTKLPLSIIVNANDNNWNFNDQIIANAPKLRVIETFFEDTNDSAINPNETLDLVVKMINEGHTSSGEIILEVNFDNNQITYPEGNTVKINNLDINESSIVKIKIHADETIPVGIELNYTVNYTNRTIQYEDSFSTIVSLFNSIDELKNILSIYPNPVTDFFKIESNFDFSKIEILNNTGQIVLTTCVNDDNIVDVTTLSSGMYIVKVYNNKNCKSFKIIKK